MSFNSWPYGVFLGIVFLLYWQLPWRGRLVLLLGASYFFYGFWDVRFLALLLTSTTIDYYCGLAINGRRDGVAKVALTACLPAIWLTICATTPGRRAEVHHWIIGAALAFPMVFTGAYEIFWRLPEVRQRRAFLLLSIVTNLGVLGFFKYFNFFADSLSGLLGQFGWRPDWVLPHIILPVAISFYTFQSIAYSVDIYNGKAKPAQSLLTFAAYLSFFPQLVAGPIERPNHLLPQFEKSATWDIGHLHAGLRLILIGVFKKVFVADNCAMVANYVFSNEPGLNGPWAILGVIAFAFQIYGDFSGYTDIARGSARLLGIELSPNFNSPYSARSPSEFWQRWHITLSTWFRDYVYIPLGGNRCGPARMLVNLWITMLLAGLWHGASWTFILWGAYHAALLTLYRWTPALRNLSESKEGLAWRIPAGVALMFPLTLAGWAIFRSHDPGQLHHWLQALANWSTPAPAGWLKPAGWLLLHAGPLLLLQAAAWRQPDEIAFENLPWVLRGVVYAVFFLGITTTLSLDYEFIYFQF